MMFFFENLSKRLVAFTTRADLEREGQGHPRACSALFLRTEWAMVDYNLEGAWVGVERVAPLFFSRYLEGLLIPPSKPWL